MKAIIARQLGLGVTQHPERFALEFDHNSRHFTYCEYHPEFKASQISIHDKIYNAFLHYYLSTSRPIKEQNQSRYTLAF